MANLLSHNSIVEICTFIPEDAYKSLPNREWRFTAKHCVVRDGSTDFEDIPPAEYFSSEGFRIIARKHSLAESLDIVFSPGEPIMLWKAVRKGLVDGILKRYRAECKESLAMRNVVIIDVDIRRVWINAYYTSFPCRQCSTYEKTEDEYEVFHLIPPCAALQSLSLKYTPYDRIEIVNFRADCASSSMITPQVQQLRAILRLADIRHEAFRCLPRADLDTCLLVNGLWSADVQELSFELALRQLTTLGISYFSLTRDMCFDVSCREAALSPDRRFWLPQNAAVDSAIAVNHLRNCAAPTEDGFTFEAGACEIIDDSVGDWISGLLRSVENFSFEILNLHLESVDAADVIGFLKRSRSALHATTENDELSDVWLRIDYPVLERLAEEHFLQWPYMQNLKDIHLETWLIDPELPGYPTWARALFQLPNCESIAVEYCRKGDDAPDCSGHIFVVLRELTELFESAADVNGFPDYFEFILRQPELTWEHQEPTPTHANVPAPYEDGPWNVYVTKNRATDAPLSVFVNTKENCRGLDENEMERRFVFRKELYTPVCRKSRKRPLQ